MSASASVSRFCLTEIGLYLQSINMFRSFGVFRAQETYLVAANDVLPRWGGSSLTALP